MRYERGDGGGSGNPSDAGGRAPGIAYPGVPQAQRQGLVGRVSRAAAAAWSHLYHGKDPNLVACGPLANEECADVADRFLQQCLRNFHLHASPPTWIGPPSKALPVDLFINAFNGQQISAPTYVNVLTLLAQAGEVIVVDRMGMSLESAAAYSALTWRLQVGGTAYSPYTDVNGPDLFNFQTPTRLANPIILRGGKALTVDARTTAVSNNLNFRLQGWRFQPYNPASQDVGGLISD